MPKLLVKSKEAKIDAPNKFTDLRQVMDLSKPTSIFYSGVETTYYFDIIYNMGNRDFLMSFEYAKGRGAAELARHPGIRLFIDSGAYTYQNDPQYEEWTNEQWEAQIVKYLTWAKKHKDQIFAIADLDLQYLPNVGYEKVYEWRRKYFEPFMLETGIPVCFIYHEDGLDVWESMCKRYPYVGMSLAMDKQANGREQLKQMFRIAEKYNTVCHGMASTDIALLSEMPFFTVDSTTWEAGVRYGEISVWKGVRMSRIKREQFESKAYPIIQNYKDAHFDIDKLREDNQEEMVRVNVYAFMMGEEYVRDRLKARMYWLKAKAQKTDANNLPDDFFPTSEWFQGDLSDIKDYALKMNINPEAENVYDLVFDMTVILNWDDFPDQKIEYLKDNSKLLNDLHDLYVNRVVNTDEEKLADLQQFYRDCIAGKNDTLLHIGTNFDRIVRERENYITDDEETEIADLSEEELRVKLYGMLPSPSDAEAREQDVLDADALNDEIFSNAGVIPVRDEHGLFVKGQMVVRKPKRLYSKKFPKFACDTCHVGVTCQQYKPGHVCAFQKMFERYDSRNMKDIILAMQGMADHNMARLQKKMIEEVMTGGYDPVVSQLVNQNMSLLSTLQRMYESGSNEVIRQTRAIRSDGSSQEITEVVNPQSGGILERLFGNRLKDDGDRSEVVDGELVEPKGKNSRYSDEIPE